MSREELPNRRQSELRDFQHNGQRYSLGVSYFPGTKRVAEESQALRANPLHETLRFYVHYVCSTV